MGMFGLGMFGLCGCSYCVDVVVMFEFIEVLLCVCVRVVLFV